MKRIFLAIIPAILLGACTPENNTTTCTTASGTEMCFDGKTYTFDDVFWEQVGNHIEIQLEPNPTDPNTKYAGCYVFLYGTTIQTDTVPHVGTYTSIPYASPSTGSLDFNGSIQTVGGGDPYTIWNYEQDAANTLTITAYSGGNVSGNGSYKVRHPSTNEVKTGVFSFENIPYQP